MNTSRHSFGFRSFRTRLITFLLALLVPVLGGIFYYVNSNTTEYTEETINSYLQLGAEVFDATRDQQTNTLEAIINSLSGDFAFRATYAENDPATLFDAALNVMLRSLGSADMLMIVDLDYKVIIDTETQGFDTLEGLWRGLLDAADGNDEGRADAIITIEEVPFQLIALPLYLPRQVAWVIGGFELDTEFVEQVRTTTLSEVSIIRISDNREVEVLASTLSQLRREILAQQINFSEPALGEMQRVEYQSEEFISLLRRLYGGVEDSTQILAVIQRSYDENSANVMQARQLLIQFYGLVLIVSLLAVLFLARSITNPITKLVHVVKRIEDGDYQRSVSLKSRDELGELADSVNSMARGLAEKERVRALLGKVVSHQIAEQLLNNPVELGGEERVATILFSDIRGFTSFCEGLAPQQVLQELNKVLSEISNIIEANGGVVDKFQGDAVMALFGAPLQNKDDAANAMAAALEIIAALEAIDSELGACVGINTGLVVAGNLGSSNRMNYSVIGDTVNLAARLESLTRFYHVSNIVSEASKGAAPQFTYRELDEVQVAGKTQAVKMFELIGDATSITASKKQEIERFESALELYRGKNWDAASAEFSELLRTCDNTPLGNTPLCQVFLDRINYFRNNPPADDWRGVFVFDKK